jgi:transposase
MSKHKSEDFKLSAVKYYLKIKNQRKTCKIFNCSERSLIRWVKKYNNTGEIKRKPRIYTSYKVKQIHVNYMKKIINKNKTITMNDLLQKVKNKFKNVNYSKMQVYRIIRDNNITLKQTKTRHILKTRFRKPVNINKKLREFYEEIKKYKLDDIISIDETSLNAYEVRKHCYEKIGKRCIIKTSNQEVFKKYTGIFAINTKGIVGYIIYDKGGIDSKRLIEFIKQFINNKYKKKLIIMDNASSHRNKKVKEEIEKHNKLLYSIPYQHFTNSIIKSKLRKTHDIGLDKLKKNIKIIIENIPKSTYENIFKGSYNRNNKFIPKKRRIKPLKQYL